MKRAKKFTFFIIPAFKSLITGPEDEGSKTPVLNNSFWEIFKTKISCLKSVYILQNEKGQQVHMSFFISLTTQDLRMKARKHQEALGLLDHEWF